MKNKLRQTIIGGLTALALVGCTSEPIIFSEGPYTIGKVSRHYEDGSYESRKRLYNSIKDDYMIKINPSELEILAKTDSRDPKTNEKELEELKKSEGLDFINGEVNSPKNKLFLSLIKSKK